MRTPSILLVFLTAIFLLPLTFATPFDAPGGLLYFKRCRFWECRVEVVPDYKSSLTTPVAATPTSPASSIPTATVSEPFQLEAPGTGSALEPTTASPTGFSSSANAGVALASHRTLVCTVLAGLLGMALAF